MYVQKELVVHSIFYCCWYSLWPACHWDVWATSQRASQWKEVTSTTPHQGQCRFFPAKFLCSRSVAALLSALFFGSGPKSPRQKKIKAFSKTITQLAATVFWAYLGILSHQTCAKMRKRYFPCFSNMRTNTPEHCQSAAACICREENKTYFSEYIHVHTTYATCACEASWPPKSNISVARNHPGTSCK